ncbi:hypothetical protein NESM_000121300 [Novymonas esmeraldas]|uniref:Uncharacterized protein n=1 Tax=Novymonas esmeraldas TaxID=1808958 RepID=A0AAW0F219_9TRYP
MSFLRPTASSLRRAVGGAGAAAATVPVERGESSATAVAAPPLVSQPVVRGAEAADSSHVPRRVDGGLRSRVGASSLARRNGSAPGVVSTSPSSTLLREFAERCDTTIQRAHEVLERTREQELKVTRALEERHSQSPSRTPTPPPPPSESTSHRQLSPAGLSAVSPAVPRAPPPTPARSRGATAAAAAIHSPVLSPPPLPAPPPTPAAHLRSPPPTQPGSTVSPAGAGDRPSPPSLLRRLRQSWRHGLSQPDESYTPSPTPSAPDGTLMSGARVSPRKSVRFASPDKLETVTPTKVVAFSSDEEEEVEDDEEEEDEEEDEEEEELLPLTKAPRVESCRSASDTPNRPSVVVPPAPPPSAVRSTARGTARSPSYGSLSPSRSAASPPSSPGRPTRSPSAGSAAQHRLRRSASGSGSRSRSRSSASSSRPPMEHDEVTAYVQQHTIRRALARLSRTNMEDYLHEEGVPLPLEGHLLKRQLLALIRARVKEAATRR